MKETICISTSIIIPMLQAAGELPAGPIATHPAQPTPPTSQPPALLTTEPREQAEPPDQRSEKRPG